MDYITYLQTPHWKQKRLDAIKYYFGKCCLCNSKDNLDVHHKSYNNLFAEPISDLIVLCRSCHNGQHEEVRRIKKDALEKSMEEDIITLEPKIVETEKPMSMEKYLALLEINEFIRSGYAERYKAFISGDYTRRGCVCSKCRPKLWEKYYGS